MSYLDPALQSVIRSRIVRKQAQLDSAYDALDEALKNAEIQSYQFDSGEGKQATTRRKPEELQKMISMLESDIARLYNRLSGKGVVNMSLRRRR